MSPSLGSEVQNSAASKSRLPPPPREAGVGGGEQGQILPCFSGWPWLVVVLLRSLPPWKHGHLPSRCPGTCLTRTAVGSTATLTRDELALTHIQNIPANSAFKWEFILSTPVNMTLGGHCSPVPFCIFLVMYPLSFGKLST